MGRAGLEPATLGLKVRAEWLPRVATRRNCLQLRQIGAAARCGLKQVAEPSPYSHSCSHCASYSDPQCRSVTHALAFLSAHLTQQRARALANRVGPFSLPPMVLLTLRGAEKASKPTAKTQAEVCRGMMAFPDTEALRPFTVRL